MQLNTNPIILPAGAGITYSRFPATKITETIISISQSFYLNEVILNQPNASNMNIVAVPNDNG